MYCKKILITGINGFIGSCCRNFFSNKGYEVFGIDIADSSSKNTIIGEVNISNLSLFNQKFDYIIHLAGSGTVADAKKAPEIEKVKSVSSTEQVLNFMKLFNPNAKLILSSSAAVYGNQYSEPVKESDDLSPISIYGLHKLEAENLCLFYSENYGLNITVIRFFSIYGNGLRKQLMWDILNKIKNIKTNSLECFGLGSEKRDFIHITDAVRFIEFVINLPQSGYSVYNCGSGNASSVRDIIEMLIRYYNSSYEISLDFDGIIREGNPDVLIANISKIVKLGFSPLIDLDCGVRDYVEWFKSQN